MQQVLPLRGADPQEGADPMIVPRLTETLIDALPFAGADEPSYYYTETGQSTDGTPLRAQNGDRPVPGFGVRVHRRSKSYVVRHAGTPHFIASFGLISLEEARTRARRKLLEIQEGPPPAREMARQKTLLDLFRKHREALFARVHAGDLRRRTFDGYLHLWQKHLLQHPDFRQKVGGLTCVTPEAIEDLKRDLADTPVAFNRALQQLHAAFRLALRLKWAEENPCEAVEPYGERPSARMLAPEEIVAWANALSFLDGEDRLSPPEVAALWALFYTGARPGEVLSLRVEWIKSAEQRAGGALLRAHLPQAKGDRGDRRGRVLRIPPPASGAVQVLFEGRTEGKLFNVTPAALRRAFARVCQEAGIEGATPKVLRHVWRSVAPEAAVDKEHLRQLGGWASHKVPDSVYIHERDEALDAGAVRIAKRLTEVSGG